MDMRVELWHDAASWDAYVAALDTASNYHQWKWRSPIQSTFGHRPHYLAAVQEGVIRGVLPLWAVRSRIFGSSLVSVPFFSYGGVAASDAAAEAALLRRAAELAGELGVARVELRTGAAAGCEWPGTSFKVGMEVELPPGIDELWQRLSSRLRNKVRRAEKHGFTAEWGGVELVKPFYSVFAENMRNLGTPVYPQQWFENLIACSPKTTEIVTLRSGPRVVAASFVSHYRKTSEAPWICSVPEGRRDYSTVLLYWSFLRRAIERGSASFDLGRCTPGSGTHAFKQLWGCRERRLYWHYWPAGEQAAPQPRNESRKLRVAIEVWKHLPLFVANTLGPRIVRSLP